MQFIVDGVTYEFDRSIKSRRSKDGEFKCQCGSVSSEHIADAYNGISYDEELLSKLNSMEATICKCSVCGQFYLETEVNDYDYYYFRAIKEL